MFINLLYYNFIQAIGILIFLYLKFFLELKALDYYFLPRAVKHLLHLFFQFKLSYFYFLIENSFYLFYKTFPFFPLFDLEFQDIFLIFLLMD